MDKQDAICVTGLCFGYSGHKVLAGLDARFAANTLSAITGASGSGKTTFLKILNRLWEPDPRVKIAGSVRIRLQGAVTNAYARGTDVSRLRRKVGMVFQTPNPLPMSIEKNVAFPLKLAGVNNKQEISARVEEALRAAFLWDEVKDRLKSGANRLSGGQQQRLCIARALVSGPEVLLLDEPTGSLDTRATARIEELLLSLKSRHTLVVVSHHMDQVERMADQALELKQGRFSSFPPQRETA